MMRYTFNYLNFAKKIVILIPIDKHFTNLNYVFIINMIQRYCIVTAIFIVPYNTVQWKKESSYGTAKK